MRSFRGEHCHKRGLYCTNREFKYYRLKFCLELCTNCGDYGGGVSLSCLLDCHDAMGKFPLIHVNDQAR